METLILASEVLQITAGFSAKPLAVDHQGLSQDLTLALNLKRRW
jgi:hypothetical protein